MDLQSKYLHSELARRTLRKATQSIHQGAAPPRLSSHEKTQANPNTLCEDETLKPDCKAMSAKIYLTKNPTLVEQRTGLPATGLVQLRLQSVLIVVRPKSRQKKTCTNEGWVKTGGARAEDKPIGRRMHE